MCNMHLREIQFFVTIVKIIFWERLSEWQGDSFQSFFMLHSACNLEEEFIWVYSLKREFSINVLLSGGIAAVVTIRRIWTHMCTNTEIKWNIAAASIYSLFIPKQEHKYIYLNTKNETIQFFFLVTKNVQTTINGYMFSSQKSITLSHSSFKRWSPNKRTIVSLLRLLWFLSFLLQVPNDFNLSS